MPLRGLLFSSLVIASPSKAGVAISNLCTDEIASVASLPRNDNDPGGSETMRSPRPHQPGTTTLAKDINQMSENRVALSSVLCPLLSVICYLPYASLSRFS